MRLTLTIVVLATIAAVVVPTSRAADPDVRGQGAISDEVIINLCGSRLAKMFAECGPPTFLRAERGKTPAEDDVYCDYDTYGFKVHDRIIRVCFFWEEWKKPIRGIKIGDSREDVEKVLGKAATTVKDKDGAVTAYGYELRDIGAYFFTNFDKNGKVWRVEVSMK
jgi:hypothetical protein